MSQSMQCASRPTPAVKSRGTVAYLMSRFPKLTETFILYEILAVEEQGFTVEICPLQRERTSVVHREAQALTKRARFLPFISLGILRDHLHYIRSRPRAYFGALGALLRGTWGSPRYFGGALAFFPKIVAMARLLQDAGATHVHAHFASHPAAAAFVIRRLTGIPYSFTAHGSDLHRDRHMLREKVAEAAFVVAISDYNREVIVAECGDAARDKVKVVHCGVDAEVFRPTTAKKPSEKAPARLLCVGTLHEVKGQTHLIEACRLLRERGLSFECHLVGDGPDQSALERQVSRVRLDDCVRFHGRLPRQEVVELLQQADVLVAPSVASRDGRREGIPVALMEAMACEVPVVASRLSGIPELVEHEVSGLLTPPGDAVALANALETLLRDPDCRVRLARAGRSKVVEQFDLSVNAEVLARCFMKGESR